MKTPFKKIEGHLNEGVKIFVIISQELLVFTRNSRLCIVRCHTPQHLDWFRWHFETLIFSATADKGVVILNSPVIN